MPRWMSHAKIPDWMSRPRKFAKQLLPCSAIELRPEAVGAAGFAPATVGCTLPSWGRGRLHQSGSLAHGARLCKGNFKDYQRPDARVREALYSDSGVLGPLTTPLTRRQDSNLRFQIWIECRLRW